MIALEELKSRLDDIYDNLDVIDDFGVDTGQFKEQINNLDTNWNSLDTNTNSAVQVKYSKEQKNQIYILEKLVDILEKTVKGLKHATELITYVESLNVDKNTSKEEIKEIVTNIMNYLFSFNKYKEIINVELLNRVNRKLYQICKYELKYTGESNILRYLYSNELITHDFETIFDEDAEKHKYLTSEVIDIDNHYKRIHNTMLTIAINEDGYLKEKEKELQPLLESYNEKYHDRLETHDKLVNQMAIEKTRKSLLLRLKLRILPLLLSLEMMIGLTVAIDYELSNRGKYKTTKEVYSTLSNQPEIKTEYTKDLIGQTKATIYYPTDSKNARIIKEYQFIDKDISANTFENYDYESLDFTSSTYKVNKEANSKSKDQFIEVETVTGVDLEDTEMPVGLMILSNLLICGGILVLDLMFNHYVNESSAIFFSDLLLDHSKFEERKTVRALINNDYPKQNISETKKLYNKQKRILEEKIKEYEKLYSEYEYLQHYLENDGYSKVLSR